MTYLGYGMMCAFVLVTTLVSGNQLTRARDENKRLRGTIEALEIQLVNVQHSNSNNLRQLKQCQDVLWELGRKP